MQDVYYFEPTVDECMLSSKAMAHGGGYRKKRPATSQFRGVSRHINTGRFESHLWTPYTRGKNRNGMQRYLGSFKSELAAARAYDLARIKMGGWTQEDINFGAHEYADDILALSNLSFEAYMDLGRIKRRRADRRPHVQREHLVDEGGPVVTAPEPMMCTPPPTPFEPWTYDENCVYV